MQGLRSLNLRSRCLFAAFHSLPAHCDWECKGRIPFDICQIYLIIIWRGFLVALTPLLTAIPLPFGPGIWRPLPLLSLLAWSSLFNKGAFQITTRYLVCGVAKVTKYSLSANLLPDNVLPALQLANYQQEIFLPVQISLLILINHPLFPVGFPPTGWLIV